MTAKGAWIGGIVAAVGLASWFVLGVLRDEGDGGRTAPEPMREPTVSEDEAPGTSAQLVAPREPAEEDAPPGRAEPVGPVDTRSPLARDLDEVGASFLGEDPRVAELLQLIQELAAQAVVDLESLDVQRDEADELRFARGNLGVGDLRGDFLIEEGTYHVTFPGAVAEAPWFQRDLQITFVDAAGHAGGCRATVQFQPNPAEATSRHVATGEERLIGWSLSVSPETGAELRPMTVAVASDEWRIGSLRDDEVRELPWISNTSCFDAWLRLLRPHTDR